jgi:hypothetical protein
MRFAQGGHVYPAIAIADALGAAATAAGVEAPVEVHFAGTSRRMEWAAVPRAGYRIHAIPAVSLHRKLLSLHSLLLPFRCEPAHPPRRLLRRRPFRYLAPPKDEAPPASSRAQPRFCNHLTGRVSGCPRGGQAVVRRAAQLLAGVAAAAECGGGHGRVRLAAHVRRRMAATPARGGAGAKRLPRRGQPRARPHRHHRLPRLPAGRLRVPPRAVRPPKRSTGKAAREGREKES